jgi:hypothetical protein
MNNTKSEVFETLFIDHPLFDISASSFALEIEKVVKTEKVDYLAAVCQLCERYEIDFSAVPKLITPTMRDKIEVAATDRKFRI